MRKKLTKRAVDAARPKERDYVLWDSDLPRFGLRVRHSGRKTYCVQFRADGRTRHITIGPVGPLTPSLARKRAIELLAEVAIGSDPAETRNVVRRAPTVAQLAGRYLEEHARPAKKRTSVEADESNFRLHVLRALGPRRASGITRTDIIGLRNTLRDRPILANRVLALLSKMFSLAVLWEIRKDNPVRGIPRFPEAKRERFLSEVELARLGAVLREAERTGTESALVVNAIRLLVFTGARKGEILNARWEHVDLARGWLRVPDSKTGAKRIQLNAPAREILDELRRQRADDSPWVIPGAKTNQPLVALTRPWHRIRARAGLTDVRIHDLRHSFASVGAGMGLSLPMIGGLLGHTQAATTQRYAHLGDSPLREANESVGARIAAAIGGRPPAKVLPLR